MAQMSQREAEQMRDQAVADALTSAFELGNHLENANAAGNLAIILHRFGVATPLNAFHCLFHVNNHLLTFHVAEQISDFSTEVVRNPAWAKEIKYQPPPQDFTVIGPSRLHNHKIVAVHMKDTTWSKAVDRWREQYAPTNFLGDPSVLEGFITPISSMPIVAYSES